MPLQPLTQEEFNELDVVTLPLNRNTKYIHLKIHSFHTIVQLNEKADEIIIYFKKT